MARILLLGDLSSSHIEKWAVSLADAGFIIGLFSLSKSSNPWYLEHKNIFVLHEPRNFSNPSSPGTKLKYLLQVPVLLRKIREFNPDLLHAHYATSYGLLGRLSGFRPFILSVWGSDVFDFPHKSFLHKALLKLNINNCDVLLSTSHAMKKELQLYSRSKIEVLPFGVDTSVFYPFDAKKGKENETVNLGIVKAIEEKYGIGTIIEAVDILIKKKSDLRFKVILVGGGTQTTHYKEMVDELKLTRFFLFTGKMPASSIPYYHNLIDIFLNVSNVNESFGVSVVEAMACEKPVIVTNAGGLKEIVTAKTGIIVNMNDPQGLADAMQLLIEDPEYRLALGREGRKHVIANYELSNGVKRMSEIYKETIGAFSKLQQPLFLLKSRRVEAENQDI